MDSLVFRLGLSEDSLVLMFLGEGIGLDFSAV